MGSVTVTQIVEVVVPVTVAVGAVSLTPVGSLAMIPPDNGRCAPDVVSSLTGPFDNGRIVAISGRRYAYVRADVDIQRRSVPTRKRPDSQWHVVRSGNGIKVYTYLLLGLVC